MFKKLEGKGKEYYALWWPNFFIPTTKEKQMRSGFRWATIICLFPIAISYIGLSSDDESIMSMVNAHFLGLKKVVLVLMIVLFLCWIAMLIFSYTKKFYRQHVDVHPVAVAIFYTFWPLSIGFMYAVLSSLEAEKFFSAWIIYGIQIVTEIFTYIFALHRTVDRISKGHYKKNGEGFFSDKSGKINNKFKVAVALAVIFVAWYPLVRLITMPFVKMLGESNQTVTSIIMSGLIFIMVICASSVMVNQTIAAYYMRHFREEVKFVDDNKVKKYNPYVSVK
jgi:hypothetical protein